MQTVFLVVLIAAVAIAFGSFSSWLANRKNYSGVLWFWLGLVFNVIALLAMVGAPENRQPMIDDSRTPRIFRD